MNNEQLRKEFEAWAIKEFPLLKYEDDIKEMRIKGGYEGITTQCLWRGYVGAAKSRDELIGKWLKQLSATYNLCTPFECGDGLAHTINTILAKAKAQGYGE